MLAALDAGAAHPHGLAAGVVIATQGTLGNWHAPELRLPENNGLVEQAAPLEVGNQTCDWLVHFRRVHPVILEDAAVSIPGVHVLVDDGPAVKLHEANTPLDEPSG